MDNIDEFLAKLTSFLKENAKGEVRIMVLSETSSGQFWISSMIDSVVWQWGMLRTTDETIQLNYCMRMEEVRERLQQEKDAENFMKKPVEGKVQ